MIYQCHVNDLTNAMLTLVDKSVETEQKILSTSPYQHYYIVNGFDLKFKDIADIFAKLLRDKGIAESDKALGLSSGAKLPMFLCVLLNGMALAFRLIYTYLGLVTYLRKDDVLPNLDGSQNI